MMSTQRPRSTTPFTLDQSGGHRNVRPELKGSQNSQRSYERYLALAQAQAQAGDLIGAENYYQHAELEERHSGRCYDDRPSDARWNEPSASS
jgi:Domain of unknown function (DUF4167)